jgi:hypothetical protein
MLRSDAAASGLMAAHAVRMTRLGLGREGPIGSDGNQPGRTRRAGQRHRMAPFCALACSRLSGWIGAAVSEDRDMPPMRSAEGQPIKSVGFDPSGRFLGMLTEVGCLLSVDLAIEGSTE